MIKRQRVTAMVFAAAALAAGSGWAQMPGGPRGAGPEGMGPQDMGQGMGPMRGYERLHKQLNLNPQQEALWQKAKDAQRESFKTMRAKGEETRAKLRVEIDKPGADLKQFAQLGDQMRTQMREQMEASHKQVRAAWFGVYDALDANQKEQVRVAIRDGMDRAGRMGRHHRGGPQGERFGERSGAEHEHG
jgi:Spy/CpxP family protein refolding chaperone